MITIETADNALKSFYLDAVTEALNLKVNPLLAKIGQSTADVVGKDVRKLVKVGVSGGIGAGTETGDLPSASETKRVQFVSTLKNLYGTIEISDKALRASATNEGAFVDLLNDEMQSLVKSASFHFGRMLFGDGSGYLTDIFDATRNEIYTANVQNVAEGMIVDFYKDGQPVASLQKRKIVAVDRVNRKIFIDGEPTDSATVENTQLYLHDAKDYELTGLKAIFDSEELYGMNKEGNFFLKPYKETDVGDITENIIQYAMDCIEEASGSKVNFIVCSWGVKRALVEYYRSLSTILPTVEFENGLKAMSFNGVPVVADRFCPEGTMYLLNTDDYKLHQLCDWKWLEGEDGKILKQIPGKPVYTATLVKYAELMCERPAGQGVLTGITEQ
jgi:hypothetical protein